MSIFLNYSVYFCSFTLCLIIAPWAWGTDKGKPQPVQRETLTNESIYLELTPQLGGRVLSFSLKGKPNLIKVGPPVATMPKPAVNAEVDNIAYLGHIVWLGPQSQWWRQQQVNLTRYQASAVWPPDPYTIFAENRILEKTSQSITLEGVASPVSGIKLTKKFTLVPQDNNAVLLEVEARNIRQQSTVAWDIWFNTRVRQDTQVYVPVNSENDIRLDNHIDDQKGPLDFVLVDGLFSLKLAPPEKGRKMREGKFFIQPSAGWLAGFSQQQLFIIQFPLVPKAKIHPEHGQVELYVQFISSQIQGGLIEMEVHSPFTQFKPGEIASAREYWTVLAYDGPNTAEAQRAFLRKNIVLKNWVEKI